MSAVNIYRLHDRVVIHTDAAAYTTDDVVVGSALKVVTFPAQAMAVAVRGPAAFSAHIATSLVAQFKNIAEARQGDSYFKAMVPALKEFAEMSAPGHGDFQAFFGGIGGGTAHSFALSSETEPYEIIDLDPFCVAPVPTALDLGDIDATTFDADVHGLAVLDAQRKDITMGLHAVSTVITADSITQRVIKTWPDQIGQKIRVAAND